eukprot:CAMPEP_0116938782 /NCGR_PEP_ID=MMETSP0467-20121206/32341_1 /TAXON_ID=283647 /ORGANISM="Mesodinium pulex, Strain SPMC105" /LENGTH=140 /DNA_ID=CAMNT_0004620927 /DNA_START=1011 /DNA_END=1433 /DNA_ORIENTATION=-
MTDLFLTMDVDHDGSIDQIELTNCFDIVLEDFEAASQLSKMLFDFFDVNHNNSLDIEEFKVLAFQFDVTMIRKLELALKSLIGVCIFELEFDMQDIENMLLQEESERNEQVLKENKQVTNGKKLMVDLLKLNDCMEPYKA